jgi:hypothetical protein
VTLAKDTFRQNYLKRKREKGKREKEKDIKPEVIIQDSASLREASDTSDEAIQEKLLLDCFTHKWVRTDKNVSQTYLPDN